MLEPPSVANFTKQKVYADQDMKTGCVIYIYIYKKNHFNPIHVKKLTQ